MKIRTWSGSYVGLDRAHLAALGWILFGIHKLTGGRPMTREGFAFIDKVSGESVHYWRDKFGRRWMANGPWSSFRVAAPAAGQGDV